jgi:hypothetical protein
MMSTEAKKKRSVGRRSKKEEKSDDGELEPFALKDFFIPDDRGWVMPMFIIFVIVLFGYYMVGFIETVDETCDLQEVNGDDDCDGYEDNPSTESDDSSGSGNETNSTSQVLLAKETKEAFSW